MSSITYSTIQAQPIASSSSQDVATAAPIDSEHDRGYYPWFSCAIV